MKHLMDEYGEVILAAIAGIIILLLALAFFRGGLAGKLFSEFLNQGV